MQYFPPQNLIMLSGEGEVVDEGCIIENMSGKFTCNPISYNIYWKKEKDRLKKYEI